MAMDGMQAGMSGIDKDHVQKVIHDMSKNSKYYQNARHSDAKHQKRIQRKLDKLENATKHELMIAKREAQSIINQAEANRRFSHVWVVIDMDMFFAAVEMRDNPGKSCR
jgi:DNA polymerase kappa